MSQSQLPEPAENASASGSQIELTLQVLDENGNPDSEGLAGLAAFLRENGIEVHLETVDSSTVQQ